jgi:hypothetical protein
LNLSYPANVSIIIAGQAIIRQANRLPPYTPFHFSTTQLCSDLPEDCSEWRKAPVKRKGKSTRLKMIEGLDTSAPLQRCSDVDT